MNVLLNLIILILAIPVGYIIVHLCRDELKAGREWFKFLVVLGAALGFFFYFFDFGYIALTCFFVSIVSLISYMSK